MLWLYERDTTSLWLETRYDNTTAEYVGVLHHPDSRQESRRFNNLVTFRQGILTMEAKLAANRWALHGPSDILSDGWPDKLPLM